MRDKKQQWKNIHDKKLYVFIVINISYIACDSKGQNIYLAFYKSFFDLGSKLWLYCRKSSVGAS